MKQKAAQSLAAVLAGALFGTGLAVSGMTQPAKIIGFLDPFGRWDSSLVFVMMGALSIHFVAYRVMRRQRTPLFGERFVLPAQRTIDRKLVAGAALFGVGWGISGYCPGPSLVALPSGQSSVLVFVVCVVVGMLAMARLEGKASERLSDGASKAHGRS